MIAINNLLNGVCSAWYDCGEFLDGAPHCLFPGLTAYKLNTLNTIKAFKASSAVA